MPQQKITRDDVTSMVGARRELGEELEPAVVDAFLDRVEAAIEERAAEQRKPQRDSGPGTGETLALAIVSLGTGVPITAIAAEQGGVLGIIAAWAGIVGVNFSFSRRR